MADLPASGAAPVMGGGASQPGSFVDAWKNLADTGLGVTRIDRPEIRIGSAVAREQRRVRSDAAETRRGEQVAEIQRLRAEVDSRHPYGPPYRDWPSKEAYRICGDPACRDGQRPCQADLDLYAIKTGIDPGDAQLLAICRRMRAAYERTRYDANHAYGWTQIDGEPPKYSE